VSKEAIIINKFSFIFNYPKIAKKEVSYDFEILHGFLGNQKNNIPPVKKILIPPFTPHNDLFEGELYFSSKTGCPRVLKLCMCPSVTKIIVLQPKKIF
jgi:hypothetical protein